MSAERLREAAALMRERAEAATPGPWQFWPPPDMLHDYGWVGRGGMFVAEPSQTPEGIKDAVHIASWHPAVALAVADLLDNEASLIEGTTEHPDLHMPLNGARVDLLLAVADAYLSTPAPKEQA